MGHLGQAISKEAENRRDEAVSFLQDLIRTPSPSGQETEAAELVADKMRSVGFDAVKVDRLNDIMATFKGGGRGRSLLLNGHLDHVPAGDMINPYSGRAMDGTPFGVEGEVIYGRAASDMKAAVAAMVMAGAVIREIGVKLKGDFKVAAVALEETGGIGTKSTIQEGRFLGDLVVMGEATNMDIALGHRGTMGMSVAIRGESCHASDPERGINALYKAVEV